jgi:hypothetical protein
MLRLEPSKRKLVTVGHAVGIIAAQSIGEPERSSQCERFILEGVFGNLWMKCEHLILGRPFQARCKAF